MCTIGVLGLSREAPAAPKSNCPKSNWPKSSILEQGDPLMPLLFSLGQHRSLDSISGRLRAGEKIMANLDDVRGVRSSPGQSSHTDRGRGTVPSRPHQRPSRDNKCGTVVEWNPVGSWNSLAQLSQSIPRLSCGKVTRDCHSTMPHWIPGVRAARLNQVGRTAVVVSANPSRR